MNMQGFDFPKKKKNLKEIFHARSKFHHPHLCSSFIYFALALLEVNLAIISFQSVRIPWWQYCLCILLNNKNIFTNDTYLEKKNVTFKKVKHVDKCFFKWS